MPGTLRRREEYDDLLSKTFLEESEQQPDLRLAHRNDEMAAFQRFINATTATLPRQCASAGFLFATGDVIAQQVIEKRGRKHDVIRTARLATYGGLIFSPIAAVWLGKVLERVPAKGFAGVAAKVGLDQSIAAPTLLGIFFTSTTLMEGKSFDDVRKKLKQSYWSTLLTSWCVWIPVQTINMAFVPPQQRLLFINVVSIFWNTFLALVAGGGGAQKSPPMDEYGLREGKPQQLSGNGSGSSPLGALGAGGSKLVSLGSALPFAHSHANSHGTATVATGQQHDMGAALREIKADKMW